MTAEQLDAVEADLHALVRAESLRQCRFAGERQTLLGACGGTGQPCCPANGGADGGVQAVCQGTMSCLLAANGGNQCGPCGCSGEACCGMGNAGTCSGGFACTGRNVAMGNPGMWAVCGEAGEACCSTAGGGTACNSATLACIANQCTACGGVGQACCGAGTCTAGLACAGRNAGAGMAGMCTACGAAGQLCCPTNVPSADGGPPPTACQAALGVLNQYASFLVRARGSTLLLVAPPGGASFSAADGQSLVADELTADETSAG